MEAITLPLALQLTGSHRENQRVSSGSLNSTCNNQYNNDPEPFKLPPQPCKRTSPPEHFEPKSTEISFHMSTSRVRQRKFPGPAGLLPDRGRTAQVNKVQISVLLRHFFLQHFKYQGFLQGQRPNFSSLLNTSESDLDESEVSGILDIFKTNLLRYFDFTTLPKKVCTLTLCTSVKQSVRPLYSVQYTLIFHTNCTHLHAVTYTLHTSSPHYVSQAVQRVYTFAQFFSPVPRLYTL